MNVLYCDITNKPIRKQTTVYSWETKDDRYDTILNKDLSPDGMKKLLGDVEKKMSSKRIYSLRDYQTNLKASLLKLAR